MSHGNEYQEVYEAGMAYNHYAGTAYPLSSRSFSKYRFRPATKNEDHAEFESKQDGFDRIKNFLQDAAELILRVHIPDSIFFIDTNESVENDYVDLLIKEIIRYSRLLFVKKNQKSPILAYDLCGGMACKLSIKNLKRITEAVKKYFRIEPLLSSVGKTSTVAGEYESAEVLFSIEATPMVADSEHEKLKVAHGLGYDYINLSLQPGARRYYSDLNLGNSKIIYRRAVNNIRSAGIGCLNIDVMYGFPQGTEGDAKVNLESVLNYVVALTPDSVTLCRNCYRDTDNVYRPLGLSIHRISALYNLAYDILTNARAEQGKAAEYEANVGGTIFVRKTRAEAMEAKTDIEVIAANENNDITRNYLTTHIVNGTPYVGLGLAAQTFGPDYMSYNMKRLERYLGAVRPVQEIYLLPREEFNGKEVSSEFISKVTSESFYKLGFVDMTAFEKRFGISFKEYFREEINFAQKKRLLEIRDGRIYLTERGANFVNGVIALFYSKRSQHELKAAVKSQTHIEAKKCDEDFFISNYSIANHYRPLVETDIVALKMKITKDPENKRKAPRIQLSILLIRRGEYPYMLKWALPGGFMQIEDKDLEACANRELKRETNVEAKSLLPVGVFSDRNRDPRGQVVSCAYVAMMDMATTASPDRESDILDARWFDVEFKNNSGAYQLTLTSDDIVLESTLTFNRNDSGQKMFKVEQSAGLAFDHAKIIAHAIKLLRHNFENFETIFDFMPKVFTISELQMLYDAVMGNPAGQTASADFRRKVNIHVEHAELETVLNCYESLGAHVDDRTRIGKSQTVRNYFNYLGSKHNCAELRDEIGRCECLAPIGTDTLFNLEIVPNEDSVIKERVKIVGQYDTALRRCVILRTGISHRSAVLYCKKGDNTRESIIRGILSNDKLPTAEEVRNILKDLR